MKFRPISQKEKNILYITLAALAAAVVFNLVIVPLVAKLSDMRAEIADKKTRLDRYLNLISKGEGALSVYESYKADLEAQKSEEDVVNSLFEQAKSAAGEYGLNLERIKPYPAEKEKGYKEVSLEIELKGNFASIFKFINYLETSSSLVKILSFRLVRGAGAASELLCKIVISRAFFVN